MSRSGVLPGRVLVVGSGIGGLATAIRLAQSGWEPVVVERALGRRTGGYFIATMGTGQAAARRLGILDALPDRTPPPGSAMYDVDRSGKTRPTRGIFDLPVTPKPMLMLRGDVEHALFDALPSGVQVRYCTVPTAIAQDPDGVDVVLHDMATDTDTTERFDLVVGADGLRSTVRRLVFGPHEKYLRRLNHIIAACELNAAPMGLGPSDGAMLFEPGRSLIVYPFADHPPTALFSYRTDDVDAEFLDTPVQSLRLAFGPPPYGDLLEEVITAFGHVETSLFDSAEQTHMRSWHRGRVVLVGDAAWCPTLYPGMGSASALAGADLLGAALDAQPGNLPAALNEWEDRLRPFTDRYQKIGEQGALGFTPPSRQRIRQRRALTTARELPLVGPLIAWNIRRNPSITARNVDILTATQPPVAAHKVSA